MEVDHRLGLRATCFHGRRFSSAIVVLLISLGFLTSCALSPGDDAAVKDRIGGDALVSVIVSLDVGLPPGQNLPEPADIEEVSDRFLARLKPLVPSEQFEKVRTYALLPAVALSVDPDLVAEILSWPEVKSVSLDRTLTTQ